MGIRVRTRVIETEDLPTQRCKDDLTIEHRGGWRIVRHSAAPRRRASCSGHVYDLARYVATSTPVTETSGAATVTQFGTGSRRGTVGA